MHNTKVSRILARQDGVISLPQTRDCGISQDILQRKVSSGEWQRKGPAVYRDTSHAWSDAAKLRAAVMSAGKDACAYGRSAAWWHGLTDSAPATQFVTIPKKRYLARADGTKVRSRDLPARDLKTVRGLRVTAVPLTVLESNDSVLMDRALQTRVTLPILHATHARHLDRAGAKQTARLLTSAGEGGRSEAERMLHRILRNEGFTGWRAQYETCGFALDAVFERQRVCLEVDGWRWHKDAHRNSHDLKRQNILVNAGWHVLRFDWHRLDRDPAGVTSDVRQALERPR